VIARSILDLTYLHPSQVVVSATGQEQSLPRGQDLRPDRHVRRSIGVQGRIGGRGAIANLRGPKVIVSARATANLQGPKAIVSPRATTGLRGPRDTNHHRQGRSVLHPRVIIPVVPTLKSIRAMILATPTQSIQLKHLRPHQPAQVIDFIVAAAART
jgi:hypothetical protein